MNENLRSDLAPSALAAFDGAYESLGRPKLRKNGVLAIEYVLTFSPEAAATIDPQAWGKRSLEFVEARHGRANIISAHLHLDEKTPHVHIMAVPAFAGAVVVAPFMGSRGALRRLQDEFYRDVSSHFGLARCSENPTGRKHVPPGHLRAGAGVSGESAAAAVRELQSAAAAIPVKFDPISLREAMTSHGRDAHAKAMAVRAKEHVDGCVRRVVTKATEILESWSIAIRDALLIQAENQAMKSNRIRELREIDLCLIAERILAVPGRRQGPAWVWETDAHKLVVTGTQFKDFKQGQRGLGGGAIDLVMHLLGCDYMRALGVLAADFAPGLTGSVRAYHARIAAVEAAAAMLQPRRTTFEELRDRYAKEDAAKLNAVRRYLSEDRGIPLAIIEQAIQTGDLWANSRGSCVFAHRDRSGDVHGCSIRATWGDFKQCLGDKTNAWFGLGAGLVDASRLVLTESPIDALSFHALGLAAPSDRVISTAGQTDAAPILALKRAVVCAQDHDTSGEMQAAAFATGACAHGLQVARRVPDGGKDWNEQLLAQIHEHRRNAEDTARRERESALREQQADCRKQRAERAAFRPAPQVPAHRFDIPEGGFGGSHRGRSR